jgi:hypothetical protein
VRSDIVSHLEQSIHLGEFTLHGFFCSNMPDVFQVN